MLPVSGAVYTEQVSNLRMFLRKKMLSLVLILLNLNLILVKKDCTRIVITLQVCQNTLGNFLPELRRLALTLFSFV